jgi:thiosulfate/3-mercaptopyruvate sulfurtransferase
MLALITLLSMAPNPELLVSVEWLAAHRTDPEIVILHVARERADYDKGHVPGARFVPAQALWTTAAPGVELPPVAQLDSLFQSLGVNDRSRIVFYGDTWAAPRAFLALDFLGLGDRTAMLNGGLGAWTKAGHPSSTEVPSFAPGTITPHPRTDIVVDAAWLAGRIKDPGLALVDGRSEPEYAGTTDREKLVRFGHIPGAKLLPWERTFTDTSAALEGVASPLVAETELRRLFTEAGAGGGRQLVTYCTVGLRASHLYFIARLLGLEPKIYDGSMRDWSGRAELPMEK